MRNVVVAVAGLALAGVPALAQPISPGSTQPPTVAGTAVPRVEAATAVEFVTMAATSDMFEVQSSQLAMQRAQAAEVKRFAQEMVEDHQTTTQQMQQLVQRLHGAGTSGGASAPASSPPASSPPAAAQAVQMPQQLDARHARMLQQLQQAEGAEFDRLYMRMQVQAHQTAVDLFRDFSRNGSDSDLRQFATQTLPNLEDHLRKAQRLQQQLG